MQNFYRVFEFLNSSDGCGHKHGHEQRKWSVNEQEHKSKNKKTQNPDSYDTRGRDIVWHPTT